MSALTLLALDVWRAVCFAGRALVYFTLRVDHWRNKRRCRYWRVQRSKLAREEWFAQLARVGSAQRLAAFPLHPIPSDKEQQHVV